MCVCIICTHLWAIFAWHDHIQTKYKQIVKILWHSKQISQNNNNILQKWAKVMIAVNILNARTKLCTIWARTQICVVENTKRKQNCNAIVWMGHKKMVSVALVGLKRNILQKSHYSSVSLAVIFTSFKFFCLSFYSLPLRPPLLYELCLHINIYFCMYFVELHRHTRRTHIISI